MGVMYAMKCDICEDVQVKEKPHEIKGKTYQEDGKTMFSCDSCRGKLKTALSLGKGGLDDPLKAAAALIEMKDSQIRNLEMKTSAKSGDIMGVAEELRKKRDGGGFIPILGLDFGAHHTEALSHERDTKSRPALPAPEPKNKGRKKKK